MPELCGDAIDNDGNIYVIEDRNGGTIRIDLTEALIEGYFGIRLDRDSLSIEPRLGTESGRIHVDLPSCGRFAAYEYEYDAPGKRITLRFASNVPGSGEIRILSPWPPGAVLEGAGKRRDSGLETTLDGQTVPHRIEAVLEDEYIAVRSDHGAHVLSVRRRG